MLYLTSNTKIWMATQPVDFRRQLDGLIALCENQFHLDPRSGSLFVFINRSRTMIRVLHYEEGGYWLATKRLSRGRYSLWPLKSGKAINEHHASELARVLKTVVASRQKPATLSQNLKVQEHEHIAPRC